VLWTLLVEVAFVAEVDVALVLDAEFMLSVVVPVVPTVEIGKVVELVNAP
jgi:hypothetical protein